MRVICPSCEKKAIIKSRASLSKEVSDLYCQCTNVHCSHSFVMKLAFSHTLSPPAKLMDQVVMEFIRELPKQKKQAIAKALVETR